MICLETRGHPLSFLPVTATSLGSVMHAAGGRWGHLQSFIWSPCYRPRCPSLDREQCIDFNSSADGQVHDYLVYIRKPGALRTAKYVYQRLLIATHDVTTRRRRVGRPVYREKTAVVQ